LSIALVAGSLLARTAHPSAALNPISEFPLPTPERFPLGITTGPDGNLWFVEYANGIIGRITPTGVLTEFSLAPATPYTYLRAIAAGPDNNLWFTDTGNNRIGRMTPTGSSTLFPAPTPSSSPEGITAGPDGNMWFTEHSGNAIGRITPAGHITELALPPTSNYGLGGIATGSDGNLWFADTGNNRIGRITPTGQISFFALPSQYTHPLGITAGPDGNLWFTEGNPNPVDHLDHIGRITPAGVITEFPLPSGGNGPYGITTGPDGNLWFTEQRGKIGRITPSGDVTEFDIPTSPSTPQGFAITAGPDSAVWFTEFQGNRIGRLSVPAGSPTPPTSAPTASPPSPTAPPTPLPSSCLAYGVADLGSATSQFFTLDPRTTAIRDLGSPQEDADIEAVALVSTTNELFAATGSNGSQDGYLFHFDRASDTLTAIGATSFSKVNALAFRPSDGSLWGWVADQGLIKINPDMGASTLVHPAHGDSSAIAWSADGAQLYITNSTKLWVYDPVLDVLTTLGDNFPTTSIVLSVGANGQLLGGVEHDQTLILFLYNVARRQVVARTTIPVPYDDLEAIAWPGACADVMVSDVPALGLSSVDRGAPESFFPLHATGFSPGAGVTLTVNGARIGTATADAGGELLLTLHFNTQAAPGVYAINASEQPATSAANRATWGAETQVTVDPAAPQLPRSGDALVVDGTLAVYLPLIR
jgi:streptogramin lyase